jgi:hypothetical protein
MTEDEEVGVEAESAATPVEEEAGEPQSEPAEDGRKGGASVFLLDSFRKMD